MSIVASFFNLGGPDLIVILLVALLFFGAKRLPELARGLGQAMNEFHKAKEDMHRQITHADEPLIQRPADIQERSGATPAEAPAATTAAAPSPQAQAPEAGAAKV